MLNKIKLIGKFLIEDKKKPEEKKFDDTAPSQEVMKEADKQQSESKPEKEEKRELRFYFNLLNTAPSNSITALRCVTQGEVAERITKEIQTEDIIEVHGYLRNEKIGSQIVVKVVKFRKLSISSGEIDLENSNQVRVLGKIINDLHSLEEKRRNPEILSFFISVPREGVKLPLFFCRVNEKKLVTEMKKKLKKGDVVIVEGFLQTKREKEGWISSIICYGFTLLDSDSVDIFRLLDEFPQVIVEVTKINFDEPKPEKASRRLN